MPETNFLVWTLFWLFGFWLLWKIPFIKKDQDSSSEKDYPSFSIIIPARNEEHRLPYLLDSLSHHTVRPLEIIVVNDQSQDSTPEIALSRGARVIESGELPSGWTGKSWACWNGALRASGEVLVFLDADTILCPNGLQHLIHSFMEGQGVLSVQPYHTMKKAYEQLSAFFNILSFACMNIATPLGKKRKPLGSFGPCLVCSRKDYFSVGGHRAVKDKVLEDIDLGKKFLKAGLPVCSFGGKGIIHFRMYPGGIVELIEGWTKNFGSGAKSANWFILLMSIAWITGCLAFPSELVKILIQGEKFLLGHILLYSFYALQIKWMLGRLGNFRWWTAAFFPLPLLFFVAIFFWSIFHIFFLGHVRWKERTIKTRPPRRG